MKGNINRFQMVPDDPVNVMIAHIGKRNIISLQERKARVVILEIESVSHAFRHLINKTENALVATGTILIHQTFSKINPQILFIFFFYFKFPLFAISFFDQKRQLLIVNKKMVIKYVFNFLTIDRQ